MLNNDLFASRRKFIISFLVIASVAVVFWSGSRVPQLNEKATMGAETNINALGFDTVFVVQPSDGIAKKILYTTVNWADTNKKGMTFGVIFAACLMTGFSLLRRRAFDSGFANSALGMLLGAPLGVCVNCAAPIATGLSAAGTRIETTLATMTSSPTLNFIVVGMLFALFPFYFVAIKLILVIGFILIGIPIITKLFLKNEVAQAAINQSAGVFANQACPIPSVEDIESGDDGWLNSVVWFLKSFAKHLWFIIKNTVPLMLLAGLLGSILVTVLPWDNLADIVPGDSTLTRMLSMVVIGIVGAFLPVPIAFDIVICAVLLAAGMPARYVMVLLFTLGIYSVYSYFIVSQAISKKAASLMFGAVVLTGVVGGYIANEFSKIDERQRTQFFIEFFVQQDGLDEPSFRSIEVPKAPVDINDSIPRPDSRFQTFYADVGGESLAHIGARPFNDRLATDGTFARQLAEDRGWDIPYDFSFFKMELPYVQGYGRSVSSGDVNGDSWPDLLFLTESGIHLYLNGENNEFSRVDIDLGGLSGMEFVNAAIVDIDGDGWNDLFLATYLNGNYIVYSEAGKLSEADIQRLPEYGEMDLSPSVAFGDLDEDGDLDMIIGNWSIGWGEGTWVSTDKTKNQVLLQENRQFTSSVLDLPSSIPTSILLSDFNRDRHLDLIIGNDFGAPDYFYAGRGDGTFEVLNKSSGIFPASGYDVMSVSSADLNNDLRPEIFMAEISYYEDNDANFGSIPYEDACRELAGTEYESRCVRDSELHELFSDITQTKDVSRCSQIEDKRLREECVIMFVSRRPPDRGGYSTEESCALLPGEWSTMRAMCQSAAATGISLPESFWDEAIPQLQQKNVLLFADEDNRFHDVALPWGVQNAGWAWNSRFFDADLDGFNDLLVANGTFNSNRRRESNYLYLNDGGGTLVNKTNEVGIESRLAYSSYTLVDLDNDGDQDVVAVPINGPVAVFENRLSDNKSVAVELVTGDSGRSAIGAEVVVKHRGSGEVQMKELQLSGGFISFDHPILYFGLGQDDALSEITINWPQGGTSVIRGEFVAGQHYRITRE